jgi:hypothetical protein
MNSTFLPDEVQATKEIIIRDVILPLFLPNDLIDISISISTKHVEDLRLEDGGAIIDNCIDRGILFGYRTAYNTEFTGATIIPKE